MSRVYAYKYVHILACVKYLRKFHVVSTRVAAFRSCREFFDRVNFQIEDRKMPQLFPTKPYVILEQRAAVKLSTVN